MKLDRPLFLILALSLALNLYGIQWGLPNVVGEIQSTPVWGSLDMMKRGSLDPLNFHGPSLSRYLLLGALAPYMAYLQWTGGIQQGAFVDRDAAITGVFLIARSVSALLVTLTVGMTYAMAKTAYGRREGLIAALFLAVTMGMVGVAHIAINDVLLVFLTTAALLFSVRFLHHGSRRAFILAFLFAGFAGSAKYYGLLVPLIPLAAVVLREIPGERLLLRPLLRAVLASLRSREPYLGAGLALAGFAATSPFLVLRLPDSLFQMAQGMQDARGFGGGYGINNPEPAPLVNLYNLESALGPSLAVVAAAGLAYAVHRVLRKGDRTCLLLLFWTLLFYGFLSTWNIAAVRYVLLVVPPLAILAAVFTGAVFQRRRTAAVLLVGVVALHSALYSAAADYVFVTDSRGDALAWIRQNVETNATIETYARWTFFQIPGPYKVLDSPPREVEFFGREQQRQYDLYLAGLRDRRPDYVVLSNFHYGPYFLDPQEYPNRTRFFDALIRNEAGYRTVAQFPRDADSRAGGAEYGWGQRGFLWGMPQPEWANPTLLILRREPQ